MISLPYLTANLPGIGGVIKRFDDDFRVEEAPLYEPSGEGTHVYFCVEKAGMTTPQAINLIASALGVGRRDIGYAGLKDAHAVTRQVFSVEHVDARRVEALDINRCRVLWVNRHTNKIKLGHLAGNRFVVRVREVEERQRGNKAARQRRKKVQGTERGAQGTGHKAQGMDGATARAGGGIAQSERGLREVVGRAWAILDVLEARGAPNYFGGQRFGARGDNAAVGLAALRGDYDEAVALMLGQPNEHDNGDILKAREHFDRGDLRAAADAWPRGCDEQRRLVRSLIRFKGSAGKAWRSMAWPMRRLMVSALQSELFNRVVARRIEALDRLMTGDLAMKHVNGAVFRVEDAAVEQPRCDAFEISPTGPLFGHRMTTPQGKPAQIEAEVIQEAGLAAMLTSSPKGERLDGARRAMRVQPKDVSVDSGSDERGAFVEIGFMLPPGAYATVVLGEVCKEK